MHKNIGRLKEDEFVFAIDGKRAEDLSHNLKHILREIFGLFDGKEILKCGLVEKLQKPDFYIEYKGIRKYISLKTGRAQIVGEGDLKAFLEYLRSWHLSVESQKTFLYYHFGDGTMDGSGEKRMEYFELVTKLNKRIILLNEELNRNKDFIKDVVHRLIFKGWGDYNLPADYIYFGDVNYGVVCSETQIFKHIDRRDWAFMDNPHIGPIQFRPHARYINSPIKKEKSRWKIDFWWANLSADLEYIAERYDG